MTFEEYIPLWYKNHTFAKHLKEKNHFQSEYEVSRTLIIQKMDWIHYCSDNNIDIEIDFFDTLFSELLQDFAFAVCEGQVIDFTELIEFLKVVPKYKASEYDGKLLKYVNNLLKRDISFENKCSLFVSWAKNRQRFLYEIELGISATETGWMPAFYRVYRKDFLEIRDTDFPTMLALSNYFTWMYYECTKMERKMMAGDIVKVHDFLENFLRDTLVSARNNGYYEYEETAKTLIESLKAETDNVPSVFISYCWEDEQIVDIIEESIHEFANVHRDKHEVEMGDSLNAFMKTIRKQDFVILVVTDEYLKHRNCMYEILQLLKDYEEDEAFWDKIVPYVTATGIYKGEGRAKKIKYWTDACLAFEEVISKIPASASEGLVKESKILRSISMEIDKLLDHLNDEKCERNLYRFIENVKKSLSKWAQYGSNPIMDCILVGLQNGDINWEDFGYESVAKYE